MPPCARNCDCQTTPPVVLGISQGQATEPLCLLFSTEFCFILDGRSRSQSPNLLKLKPQVHRPKWAGDHKRENIAKAQHPLSAEEASSASCSSIIESNLSSWSTCWSQEFESPILEGTLVLPSQTYIIDSFVCT